MIVVCNKNSKFVTMNQKLKWSQMEQMIDNNTLFFFSLVLDSEFQKELFTKTNVSEYDLEKIQKKNHIIPDEILKKLYKKMIPQACFAFQKQKQQDLTTLLQINDSQIRQWIFTDKDNLTQAFIDEDPTLSYMQKNTKWIQLNSTDDMEQDIQNLRAQFKSQYETEEEDPIKQLHLINQRYVTLVIDQSVFEKAIEENRNQFQTLLLYPSLIIFSGLNRKNKEIIQKLQVQAAEDEYFSMTIGCESEDLILCNTRSAICTLTSIKNQNLFTQLCQFKFNNLFSTYQLILVHSRKTNIRISYLTLFLIYKSILIVTTECFFCLFHGYTSLSYFPAQFHFWYQFIFTSTFGLAIFIFYQDPVYVQSKKEGFHFWKCSQKAYYNSGMLIPIISLCVFQAFISFYIIEQILQYANDNTGIIQGFYFISMATYISLVLTVTIQLFLAIKTINAQQLIIWTINMILLFIFFNLISTPNLLTTSMDYVGILNQLTGSLKTVFIIILVTVMNCTPVLVIEQFLNMGNPNINIIQEDDDIVEEDVQKKPDQNNTTLNHNSTLNNIVDDSKRLPVNKKKLM